MKELEIFKSDIIKKYTQHPPEEVCTVLMRRKHPDQSRAGWPDGPSPIPAPMTKELTERTMDQADFEVFQNIADELSTALEFIEKNIATLDGKERGRLHYIFWAGKEAFFFAYTKTDFSLLREVISVRKTLRSSLDAKSINRTERLIRRGQVYDWPEADTNHTASNDQSEILIAEARREPIKSAPTKRVSEVRSKAGRGGRSVNEDSDRKFIKDAVLMLMSKTGRGQGLSAHAAAKKVAKWCEDGTVDGNTLSMSYYDLSVDTIKRIAGERKA